MKQKIQRLWLGVKKYMQTLRSFSYENKLPYSWVLADCLWAWLRYGCVLNQYIDGQFYRRKAFERKSMLTYRRWCHIMKKYNSNKAKNRLLQNKIAFNEFFHRYIHRDWIYTQACTREELAGFLNNHQEIIIKPIDSWEGNGVQKLSVDSAGSVDALCTRLAKEDVLLEACVAQHPNMVFANKAVNTIRVYTVCGSKSKHTQIIKATLRVGVGESIVDNSHSGGCAYQVDISTGVVCSKGWGRVYTNNIVHPGSSIVMPGHAIPFWDKVKSMCIDAAEQIPEVGFIGWDVAINAQEPLLIEGNHDPDLDMIEFVGDYGYYDRIIRALDN